MKPLLRYLLLLLLALGLTRPARATAPPATGRPLGEILNPDGTLRPGANGSFDARAFRMETMPDGRPVFRPASTKGAGDERWADGFGLPNSVNGGVLAVVQAGADVYVGGGFSAVGSIAANNVAKWNGTAWSALSPGPANGVNGVVTALAVAPNGSLYVGGSFSSAGGAVANNLACWSGNAWSPVGPGANGGVTALAVAGNGTLYAAATNFSAVGGGLINRLAQWDGTAWRALGTGIGSGAVYALATTAAGTLYAGGSFTSAGGVAAIAVARWDGTAWSSVGSGTANAPVYQVTALAVASNGDVYAGSNGVAKWNGTAWSALGVSGTVYALAVAGNGDVYIGGSLSPTGTPTVRNILKWNGTALLPLGTGPAVGTDGVVRALSSAAGGNGSVYVGGEFIRAGGQVMPGIARWDGATWNALEITSGNGVNSTVAAIAIAANGNVYVGGGFNTAGLVAANGIAMWNGTAWSTLGTGPSNGVTGGASGSVSALVVAPNGDLYVGGSFGTAGGVPAGGIAKWNGTAWSALGTGVGFVSNSAAGSGWANALAIGPSGELYAGGYFTAVDGVAANNIAKWDGVAWSSLGAGAANGIAGAVYALAVVGSGEVYVGGNITAAGGVPANNIAKWNGSTWSTLGTGTGNGVDNSVNALLTAGNGRVYVGGNFTQAGGRNANRVALWDGAAWSTLGSGAGAPNGITGSVYALALNGSGELYAGGNISAAGGQAVKFVVKWNGAGWSGLGTGLNNRASALAVGAVGKLYAGGAFSATGDGSKLMSGFAIYDPNAPLATTRAKAAPAAQLFPNPAHGAATLRLPAGAPRWPLTLHNALGQVVRRYPAPATAEAALDLRGLAAGAYVVRCGEYSQRLVVE